MSSEPTIHNMVLAADSYFTLCYMALCKKRPSLMSIRILTYTNLSHFARSLFTHNVYRSCYH